MANKDRNLLTVRQVAQACGRSPETVRRWIWEGKLPAQKLGNQLFVAAADLTQLLKGRQVNKRGIVQAIPRYDKGQQLAQIEENRRLRQRIFANHGYFDIVAAVRRSRGEH